MCIVAYDPPLREFIEKTEGVAYRELPDLLRESDFVTLHINLTRETRHIIGSQELNLMKLTAYLINTSRGNAVDGAALVSALKQRQIAGAALDVYENDLRWPLVWQNVIPLCFSTPGKCFM